MRVPGNMKLFLSLLALMATVTSQSEILKASNDRFAASMFQEVVKAKTGGNFVLSASSVRSPLAQLALASVGESYNETLQALGLPYNNDLIMQAFSAVNNQSESVRGVELHQVNGVFIRKGETLNEDYASMSKNIFNLDIKNIDFSQSVQAAREINQWVENNTNYHIKNLVLPNMLKADTVAVLANAIYVKGKWQKPFEKDSTHDELFHPNSTSAIMVPIMRQSDYFKYGKSEELQAQLVQLDYEGNQASLLVVLPYGYGIDFLVEKLKDTSSLSRAVENMLKTAVIVALPKFKIETTTDLKNILQEMNIEKIFIPHKSPLKKITEAVSDVYISDAIQKAFFEVSEEGTGAAASNAFEGPVEHFTADSPFYFELRIKDKTILNGIYRG